MGAVNDLRGLRARARKGGFWDIRAKWFEPKWLEPKWLEPKWLEPMIPARGPQTSGYIIFTVYNMDVSLGAEVARAGSAAVKHTAACCR